MQTISYKRICICNPFTNFILLDIFLLTLNRKINPEHTVPTLIDNDFVIWDSHAICTYLIDKYSDDDSLYPKDLNLRARCNQRLFFNNGNLFQRIRTITRYVLSGGRSILDTHVNEIHDGFGILEAFLVSDPFLVGDNLSLPDICVAVTIVSLNKLEPLDEERYPKANAWLSRVKEEIPFFDEINEEDANAYYEFISFKMEQNSKQTDKDEE